MIVECVIRIAAGLVFIEANIEGKVVKEVGSSYVVNFSEGIKKFEAKNEKQIRGDYTEYLVEKQNCSKK